MNESELSKLDNYSLFEIFEQIKSNCERENPNSANVIKYADLYQFITTFDWICRQFFYWNEDLYNTLAIAQYKPPNSTINLGEIYCKLQRLTQVQQEEFFKLSINDIVENSQIMEVSIIYTTDTYNTNHLEFFEQIMNLLSKKRYLKYLEIDMKEYTLPNLPQFYNLKKLTLNVKINAEELIEYCISNPNLECLTIKNNEMYGRLADIALDGKCLQNLNTLNFLMKPDIDAAEYAPLAGLPKLQELTIRGKHKAESLTHLFSRLAEKSLLRSLSIEDADLSDAEIKLISLIHSLSNVECGVIEPESIGHLKQLNKLYSIRITSKYNIPNILSEIWKLLKSIQHTIIIYFQSVIINYLQYKERLNRLDIKCSMLYSDVQLNLNDIPQMEYFLRYFPNTEITLKQYPTNWPRDWNSLLPK
ncbi:uncharacterized protein LOC111518551 [Drosophila willistoni]|uniref:uncharacterized protein LOC111518551 n=1 Tax=Drosophila willistoni TaxID=7260 RepID=UPI000C26D95B|nr:uncharacterized protein LOC111518551 [Drosophila willistoni]